MQTRAARLGLLVAAVAAAVVLFVVLKESGDSGSDDGGNGGADTGNPTAARVQVLTIKDGDPVGGVKTLTYDKGDEVQLEVRLNEPEEEIHVHGYEIERPAEHSPVRLSFPANLDGVFEIEVHRLDGTEAEIADLRVNP
jgi:FtsP/CotA-like multicopper oxidase with cupredoxin domain